MVKPSIDIEVLTIEERLELIEELWEHWGGHQLPAVTLNGESWIDAWMRWSATEGAESPFRISFGRSAKAGDPARRSSSGCWQRYPGCLPLVRRVTAGRRRGIPPGPACTPSQPVSLPRRPCVEPEEEEVEFVAADGRRIQRSIGQTWLRIDGRRVITIVVFGHDGIVPLLGAYSEGPARGVDPTNRRLVRTPGLLMER